MKSYHRGLCALGLLVVCAGTVIAGETRGTAEQITRAQAESMSLQQQRYYFVEDSHGLAQLDEKISQRIGQGSSSHYHVVYFMPQRDRDIHQALVTEYVVR
ncbi:hypothetical protein [Photobacterium atrarenae]|uniref:DUF3316 domain-containing protein n=1 Tax=Photobacterium atrarenae TaxID=865757 RepID=A0ABY5GCE5_9GAMM|nr:hypothetical protein [Photobacterium atrarenae]UTV26866.1 hypothetical protein NNL38_10945 [Photobacterium atrarenae]